MGSGRMDQRAYLEGLRPGRELIGDRGIESIETLDNRKHETLNPKTESRQPRLGAEDHVGE
jgi:hypothetical protein